MFLMRPPPALRRRRTPRPSHRECGQQGGGAVLGPGGSRAGDTGDGGARAPHEKRPERRPRRRVGEGHVVGGQVGQQFGQLVAVAGGVGRGHALVGLGQVETAGAERCVEPRDGVGAFGVGRAGGGAGRAAAAWPWSWPGARGASACTVALSVDIALLEDGSSGLLQSGGLG